MTEEEGRELATLQWFLENKMSFNALMAQQPQTLGYAVTDSPVGLLAWNGQLLGEDLDPDFAIGNVMLYWLTGTATSAARLYYENAHVTERPTEPTTVPVLTSLPGVMLRAVSVPDAPVAGERAVANCTVMATDASLYRSARSTEPISGSTSDADSRGDSLL